MTISLVVTLKHSRSGAVQTGAGVSARVQKTLKRLVDRELVEPVVSQGYRVPDVFMRQWLRRLPQQPGLPAAELEAEHTVDSC